MRLEFLGTGTSAGIPMIGCHCAVCTSTDPRDQRLRTSAALRFTDPGGQERTILIDAGPDLRQQALRSKIQRCDAILFTHNHVDHIFGLDEVRRFNAVMKAPIDIYADEYTMDSLERVYKHIFERDKNVNDSFVATLIPHRISNHDVREGIGLELFGLRCTPIPLLHGRLPVLGWRIEASEEMSRFQIKAAGWVGSSTASFPNLPDYSPAPSPIASPLFPIAYCTDVSGVPAQSWSRLAGVQTLILDCLRERNHPTHLTLNDAVQIAGQVGAERTYFVHMAHELAHQETQDRLPEKVYLAWDGLVLGN